MHDLRRDERLLVGKVTVRVGVQAAQTFTISVNANYADHVAGWLEYAAKVTSNDDKSRYLRHLSEQIRMKKRQHGERKVYT